MKKKGCLIAFLCTTAFFAVFVSIPYWYPVITHDPDISIICTDHMDSNWFCAVGGTCYHTEGDGVYSGERCVLPVSAEPLIDGCGDTLYVCDGQTVTGYNADLQQVCQYTLPGAPTYFNTAEHEIFWYDAEYQYHVWNIAAGDDAVAAQKKRYKDPRGQAPFNVEFYQDFTVIRDFANQNSEFTDVFLDGRMVGATTYQLCYGGGRQFFALGGGEIVFSSPTNWPKQIMRADTETWQSDEPVSIEGVHGPFGYSSAAVSERFITLVSLGDNGNPHINLEMMSHVHNVPTEIVYRFDRERFAQEDPHYTRSHEKIIYADENRTVTYYRSKYYIFNTADWSEIARIKAEGIQEGHNYRYAASGGKIMVFDDDSGKQISEFAF